MLVDVKYTCLTAANTYFSRQVPKNVFSNYCCIFAYARLLHLAQLSGIVLTHDEVKFTNLIDGSSYALPKPLAEP